MLLVRETVGGSWEGAGFGLCVPSMCVRATRGEGVLGSVWRGSSALELVFWLGGPHSWGSPRPEAQPVAKLAAVGVL